MKRDLAVAFGLTMIMGSLAGCWRERDPDRFEVHEHREHEEIREHEHERHDDDGDRHRDHEHHDEDRH